MFLPFITVSMFLVREGEVDPILKWNPDRGRGGTFFGVGMSTGSFFH